MKRRVTRKTKQIHKIYKECQKAFEPSHGFLEELKNIDDEEEELFYRMMCDFFLQQKQRELIKKGVF